MAQKSLSLKLLKILPVVFFLIVFTSSTNTVSAYTVNDNIQPGGDQSHVITETQSAVEISNASPISFFPGVLIDEPQNYSIAHMSNIYNSDMGQYTIIAVKLGLESSSGTTLNEIVILGVEGNVGRYTSSAGTIIILDSSGNYVSAETDAFIQNVSSVINANFKLDTQDRIEQTFPQTLSQHYANLMRVVTSLANVYAQAGYSEVSSSFSGLYSLLELLSTTAETSLASYNQVITSPYAFFRMNIVPDQQAQQCSSQIDATQAYDPSTGSIEIQGTFTAYAYPACAIGDTGYIDYIGAGYSATSWGWVGAQTGPDPVFYANIQQTSGYCTNVKQVINGASVVWSMSGGCNFDSEAAGDPSTYTISSCSTSGLLTAATGNDIESYPASLTFC